MSRLVLVDGIRRDFKDFFDCFHVKMVCSSYDLMAYASYGPRITVLKLHKANKLSRMHVLMQPCGHCVTFTEM